MGTEVCSEPALSMGEPAGVAAVPAAGAGPGAHRPARAPPLEPRRADGEAV